MFKSYRLKRPALSYELPCNSSGLVSITLFAERKRGGKDISFIPGIRLRSPETSNPSRRNPQHLPDPQ